MFFFFVNLLKIVTDVFVLNVKYINVKFLTLIFFLISETLLLSQEIP